MRYRILGLLMMLCSFTASAQVSVSIGINLPGFPVLQRVPGYPVYYAPQLQSNYFFYDGLYWIYDNDNWYASSWYNGPWGLVDRYEVPVYVLRVPVRYYRHAPAYFHGWRQDAPPRWGDHWGHSWEQSRTGWDRWNRSSAPAPAPLPTYQRQYSGSRYPQAQEQAVIQTRNYSYQPREAVTRQHFERVRAQAPAPATQPRAQKEQQQAQKHQQKEQQQAQKHQQKEQQQAQKHQQKDQQQAQKHQQQAQKQAQHQQQQVQKQARHQEQQAQKHEQKQAQKEQHKEDKENKDNKGKGNDR